jgi:uncharacterized protein
MMKVKIHKAKGNRLVVAVCDSDCLGKIFEEKGLVLDCSAEFYKGEDMSDKDLLMLVRRAYILNCVGKESVDFLIMHGFVAKTGVLSVSGVPHAQVLFESPDR